MIKKTVKKTKEYFDQSKTVKKWGEVAEKVPKGIENARKNLADIETESWYGKTGKWTGVSLLIAFQAIAKSIKILGVDNLMLRTIEIEFSKMNVGKNKKGNDKKVSFGMILALTDLSYNSGALGIMVARLNDGWTEKQVLDKMLEYRKAKIKGK